MTFNRILMFVGGAVLAAAVVSFLRSQGVLPW